MSRQRLALVAMTLLLAACSKSPLGETPSFDASVACEDRDHDGYGRDCERGYDCNDDDPRLTTECRTCSRPERGCACAASDGPISCFLDDKGLEGGDVLCSEGTRHCRDGVWSTCEDVHQYVAAPAPDTQRVVDPNAGKLPCSICDVKCFQVVDNLLADGGVAGGTVTFGPGGGITLMPGDGGAGGSGADAGGSGLTGCAAMMACCSTLSDQLKTSCDMTAAGGDNAVCDRDRVVYCPPGTINGPVPGCTLGVGADKDCDGIPDVVDAYPGTKPIATSTNQAIFHQLDIGESGQNKLELSFKLKNADVYFLMDMTYTMKEERDNLISSLTTGNVVNCAHLNQCCNRESNAAKKASCLDAVKTYTNRAGKSDDQNACLTAQNTYCPGNQAVDCPDGDGNGMPDNYLKTQGVVGATRCLVGSSWFGAGFSREVPIGYDPNGCSGSACSTNYGDRDEQLFKNVIDLTSDYNKVLAALQSMTVNGNVDEPEGGLMALHSVITGKGHYFGINRPSIPPRSATTTCPPNSFGYPCFRKDAVPIVVFFTDRPHHNGPADPTNCNGQGAGCPYGGLSKGAMPNTWTSATAESSSDKQARFVPPSAETFSTAYNIGDVRNQYYTLVGDTRFMVGDYPTAIIGCGAEPGAPDALIRFRVSPPPGATGTIAPIPVNFHLTKDDAYPAARYGQWRTDRASDPSPATEFGSVLTVFRGVPNSVSTTTNLGDRQAYAISSGPDSTYLTYTGTTKGMNSGSGFLGGISGCSADGLTNQMLFTFRPTANARIVVDASGSSFPGVVSLHEGLPGTLPKNPSTSNGTSAGIANTNDTFATANAVPSGSTSIDGAYVERTGDSNVSAIKADYTAAVSRYVFAIRTEDSDTLTQVSSVDGLYVGMELGSAVSWSATPVRIVSLTSNTVKLSGQWEGASDATPVQLAFVDSLVGCGVDPAGKDSVFKFDVATARRVRIDTEGSTFDTVISLHDAPPPSIVTKSDVAGNATQPGYSIGEVNNASYTLNATGMGTNALASNYDYAQCGAGKSSKDAILNFTLNQPTHLALEVTSASWDPVVGLFSSKPGVLTTLNNPNNNNNLVSPNAAFDLGDIYGAVDTTVKGSDLSSMTDDWPTTIVGCSATAPSRDQIFTFTPLENTRARVIVTPNGSSWQPVVSVFDDPPPNITPIPTQAAFDASLHVALPDSNCLAYSYHDPAAPSQPAHTYTVCPSKRYADDANNRCVSAGSMGSSYLVSINSAAEQDFLMSTGIPSYLLSTFHIGGVDPDGDGIFNWRDGTALTGYSNWYSGEPNGRLINNKCADMYSSGQWLDGKCSSSGAAAADNTFYVCENAAPPTAPNEDAATALDVNLTGSARVMTGSTRRMSSDYNGATLLNSCNGTISGGDAVFKVTTGVSTSYQLGVDSAGSSYNVVLGLFEGTIDAAGYKTCDAPAGGILTYTLLPNRTYYVLVKGQALSQEGTYKLKFSNLSAPAPNGTLLQCARATSTVTSASLDVDVDANHKYYVVVDQGTALFGKYDLEVHSLYRKRSEVDNATSRNETGSNALALPDPYRSRITVVDTSTTGMTSDYGNGASGMCTSSPSAPDAVYKFTPSLTTNVTFTVQPQGPGLNNVGIGVYDGLPGTSAVVRDLNATGNANEAQSTAEVVPMTGPAQLYQGNTSAMRPDVDASLLACGAKPNGRDAVFSFQLAKTTSVEIDSGGSGVADPVINLMRASPLTRPTQVTLENDTKAAADAAPSPTPNVGGSWLYYGADFSRLSADSQTSLSLAAVNDDAPPGDKQPQDLGDVAGKRFVISGGDTSPMRADYPGGWACGGNDAAPDAIYKFFSATGGSVHVKATPQGSFDGVIGLFDGANGAPLRLSDVSSLTEDTACVPPNGPKNLTNSTLKTVSTLAASAANVTLNCGNTVVVTDDPDGSGPSLVSLQNWCGAAPSILVQPQVDGPELVVFVTKNFQIAAASSLRVVGSRPVLFVVNGTANINGTLTATPDSGNPGVPGAGGDYGCGASRGGNAQSTTNNSGGGGGGGFGTAGGVGGFGSSSSVAGGAAGAVRGNSTLVPLVGGCGGGDGAFGTTGALPGGGLQISATAAIVLAASTGSIAANGANGTLGATGVGGTGAGSGGGILLQSPTITYTASQLSARGGNGGQGAGSPPSTGGLGSTGALAGNGQDSNSAAGGGGGGGGYGRVVLIPSMPVSLAPCTVATNENAGNAWPIVLDSSGRQYIEKGNTSTMTADHGGMCGAPSASPDAVYAFTLSKQSTIQIDARASNTNAVVGLFNAASLGQSPTPLLLNNDTREQADLAPAPTPNAANNWLAYRGDLVGMTPSGQPQTTVDNGGNANELIPTELPDPIDRRVTVTNASTASMVPDYLAASCSMPAADTANDALFRFVPSKSGPVRVSANYSQTQFNPVLSLYRGVHQVIDESKVMNGEFDAALAKLNADPATIKVYNSTRSVLYATPADYSIVVKDATRPVVIKRTATSTIGNGATVSVDYDYDNGAPLPISQQQVTTTAIAGNTNENALTAVQVPIRSDRAYVYTGDTTAMTRDVEESLFTCGPPAAGARDATFDFSLDKPTAVSITTEGSAFDTNLAVFAAQYTRPSTTVLRSPAAALTQLYDIDRLPGKPEASCTPNDFGSTRHWYCSTARPWEQAEGMCRAVGLHLVTIDNEEENLELLQYIQQLPVVPGVSRDHHIGFAETVPYTNSWGAWTSGGGGTEGAAVSGLFQRWAPNEPNGTGDCLQMLGDGTWDDADCAVAKAYVCEKTDTTAVVPSGATCGSKLTYGGRSYFACTDKLDWVAAKARCESASMRLARIGDEPENAQLRTLLRGNAGWIGGSDSEAEGRWKWLEGSAEFWVVTAYRNWAQTGQTDGPAQPTPLPGAEPNQPTTNPGSRMLATSGQWVDTPATSLPFPYVCEGPVIPALPTPPSTPQEVQVFTRQRQFTGSTKGVPNNVAGFIPTDSCGIGVAVAAAAPDAVFAVPLLAFKASLNINITGSFPGSVVALFKNEISATGYANAGNRCLAHSAAMGASNTLTTTELDKDTYYVVITAATTANPSSGVYNVTIGAETTDAAAFTMKNDSITQAIANPLGNADGRWQVKKADLVGLTPTIGAITPIANNNSNDATPLSLGTIQNNQVVVTGSEINSSFNTGFAPGSCGTTVNGRDAMFSFVAGDNDPIQIRFTPTGSPAWNGQVVVYDGAPSSGMVMAPDNLTPTNPNERPANARMVTDLFETRAFLGNMTMMANDVPATAFNQSFNAGAGSPTSCAADPAGNDAFFRFTVPAGGNKTVEISSANTAVAHTIALWNEKQPFQAQAAMTREYDTRGIALMPANFLGDSVTRDIDDDWVVSRGTMGNAQLTPFNPMTTWNEVTGSPTACAGASCQYKRDDTIHALGNVNGKQFVTANATTTGLAGDYLASTLQCGGTSDSAPDAIFSLSHSVGGRVRIALNNPTPAFSPNVSLFRGSPATAMSMVPPTVNVPNTNEALTSAYSASNPAAPTIYAGNTSAMANNYAGSVFTQGSAYGSRVCNPDAAGKDAFVKFVVPGSTPMNVEISSLAASFDQTIALWDSTPITAPTAMTQNNDTRAAAYAAPLGVIDDDWKVVSTTMSGLMPAGLTARAVSPASSNRDDVLDLGNPVGQQVTVTNDNTTTGVLADFPSATLGCGTGDTPADVIYKVRPTVSTRIRAALNNPSNPSFASAIAILDGSSNRRPQRFIDTAPAAATTNYCTGGGFAYTPSNFTVGTGAGQANFATAPTVSLSCGGTLTFNSTSNSWSSFCSQTQPTPVTKSQSGGPDLVILPMKSLNLASGTTIKLIGSRPVVFAVEGAVTIAGTIDAMAQSTSVWGAGAEWSCGSSTGGAGLGKGSLRGGGGGGGGFGTRGGYGGMDDGKADAAGGGGGVVRGNATLIPLIGGCKGGKGWECSSTLPGGGGGAVQISSGSTINVTGVITVNGSTGQDATCNDSGGEGGGSGGAILLEGYTITAATTVLRANGGNGGRSQDDTSGGAGSTTSATNGADGSPGDGDGAGAGGGGYGRIVKNVIAPCKPPNDTFATAPTVTAGLAQTYNGPMAPMAADVAPASFAGAGCTPHASGPDAFWKFTLTRTTTIEAKATGSGFDHTVAFFNSSMATQSCLDGTAAAGATLSRSLGPGTWYIGIKSKVASPAGNYNMAIRDTTAGVSPYAPSMACATSATAATVDANLSANNDYYIIVKGSAAGASGTYNLTVTDIGAVTPDFGCSGDLSAPDAYYDFTVSTPRNVSITLNETAGKLNGSFQLYRYSGTPGTQASDTAISPCQTSAFTYNALPAGRYYVVVRGVSVVGGAGRLPAEITIRDEGGINALDCMNTASSATGTITRTLNPGTYYAGVTSRNGTAGGAYRLQIRDTSVATGGGGRTFVACADASLNITTTLNSTDTYYVVVKGATAGAAGAYTLTASDLASVQDLCDVGDSIQMDPLAPDAYYGFRVTDADGGGRDVRVSLASTSALDGAYRLFRGGSAGTPGTAVGSCHDRSAPFTYSLAAGDYYLALRGKNIASGGANGAFELAVNDQHAYGSLQCSQGAASTGTTITRSLAPGDYFVGIKPQTGAPNPKDYRLQFRDTAVVAGSTATEIACGTGNVTANVTANKTYHVMVKGNTAMDMGPYGLVVTDVGGSSNWSCNDDSTVGDAYFEFNVNDLNGRRVTIDTEGSALDTVLAIFPAGVTMDAAGKLACDDNSGATTGSSKITRDLPQGVYYAVVRPRLGTSNTNLPFQLSVRDESVYSSVACGATTPSGKAQVRATLGPGTYHTVLKGMAGSDKGAYKIRFRDETQYMNAASEVACNDAQNEFVYNVTAGKPYYAVVKGAATSEKGPYQLTVENLVARTGMGCNANAASPDAVYRFRLDKDSRVQIDTLGSQTSGGVATDTVIALYDVTASYFGTNYAVDRLNANTSCDDDSGDAAKGWSKITADLAGNRDYYVVVKSKSSGWGGTTTLPFIVNVRDLDSNQPIACGSANSSLLMTQSLPAGDYRVVVSNSNGASGGGPFDVRFRNMTAASSGATQVACADTPEEFTYNVVAGRPYYLIVKGDAANDKGQYGLLVETSGNNASGMGCGANPAAPDAFFKFQLASRGTVTIDTEDSAADTVIALYPGSANIFATNYASDANGAVIGCDDDGGISDGASKIEAELAAGSYYVVVKGKTVAWNQTSQPFNLSIRDKSNTGSIACASSTEGNKRILQTLPAGEYNVVMSTTSGTGGPYALKFRDTALTGAENGARVACVSGGSLTVNNLAGGRQYYLVVKGDAATDAGGYKLTMEDTVSLAAASGSTSVACATDGTTIDGTYPAGTYYALVTGANGGDGGPYTLKVRDVDALLDQNRIACDDNSGPNQTSAIEKNLKAGTHYVVVKGNGADQRGAYSLHIRDADAVPSKQLVCGGANEGERLQADVRAGQDYTVLLKGDATTSSGAYDIKLYDQQGLQTGNGQNLKCLADPQPTTMYGSNWHTKPVDFDLNLTPDTYYVAVKGAKTASKGTFQLQIGDKNARTQSTYTPPTWTEIQDALATSAARVLPVIATGSDNNQFVAAAESQAKTIATASRAVRKDTGAPIWQKIQKDGRGTGSGLVTGIAEIADYLAMDVSLVAVDGPDPGASKFRINVAPGNSPSCTHPHPLVDTSTGACTPRPGNAAGYSCNTQYQCTPGAAPKFTVTFTNPTEAPVAANPNDPYGGYHFRLQIIGDKQYVLDEVPVYLVPTTHTPMGPPGGGGAFRSTGVYMQDIDTAACPSLAGTSATNDLPQWSDLYFNAGVPEGTSIDFEICTKAKKEDLATGCVWNNGMSTTRKKVTVRSKGTCASDLQCRGISGYGDGFCAAGTCQFITEPKVAYDIACADDSVCPNGPLGAGDYRIGSRCETTRGAFGYGHCVYSSQPADLGATLLTGEQGQPFARVRFTLHADSSGNIAPTLYQWNLTYYCKSAQ
jgi:hypothetical protein